MKRIAIVLLSILLLAGSATGCAKKRDSRVVIYSSCEDYRNAYYLERLNEQFPDYEIVIEYMPTGNHAAKLLAEGTKTECDISLDLEYGYLSQVRDALGDLSSYDFSIFSDDMVDAGKNWMPHYRSSGCIVVNTEVLSAKGLDMPASYADLLKPEYKGLVSMPNPKSSGTGYMFLKNLVNAWGEDEAFAYFDKLAENILQFTSSGSGPVNALVSGEAAVGLGMTGNAVTKINEGAPLAITYFEEGAPCCFYGMTMIKGKETDPAVKAVFDFFYTTLVAEDKARYFPEPIYKDRTFSIENYPVDIQYGDMQGNTPEEKERLLTKWAY